MNEMRLGHNEGCLTEVTAISGDYAVRLRRKDFAAQRTKYNLSVESSKWQQPLREAFSQFTLEAKSRFIEFQAMAALNKEIRELRRRIDDLSSQPFTVMIAILPKPYTLQRDAPVLIQPTGDDFTATLTDAGISATGDTELDAISNLKDIIIQKLEILRSVPKEKMGRIPTQQLEALQSLIQRGG